jgi:cytochrome c2
MQPSLVWVLFTGSFIFWHFPKPYQWALENEWIHTLEHLCFFVTALMFWTIVIEPSGHRRLGYGATLLHIATTAVLSGLPGALLVLAPHPLYPAQTADAALWGLTPLQDQQLAGAIMWVPAGLAYVVAVAWLFAKWMEDAERQEVKRAARISAGMMAVLLVFILLPVPGKAQGAPERAPTVKNGDPQDGQKLIHRYGCGACHMIPGIGNAMGLVGPPLDHIASRIYIAGVLRNTPDNMIRWLMHPQQVVPGNAMPEMGINRQQAGDIAAYLYTLR